MSNRSTEIRNSLSIHPSHFSRSYKLIMVLAMKTTIHSPNSSFLCNFVSGMKRFSDGNMGGPFKRSRMGPDDIEVRLLIPSKVRVNPVLYF